jgi:hypothetical protein
VLINEGDADQVIASDADLAVGGAGAFVALKLPVGIAVTQDQVERARGGARTGATLPRMVAVSAALLAWSAATTSPPRRSPPQPCQPLPV